MSFGVYVHFPWCRRRCPYCDFAIAVPGRAGLPHRAYADAVLAELAARAALFAGRTLASVYFGGGTPSLWEPDELARVLDAVRRAWPEAPPREVTVEANAEDCEPERLARLAAAGVTRVSLGVQSFDAATLAFLGRVPDPEGSERAARAAAAAGLLVSIDLIAAVPAFAASLERALAIAPPHLSIYPLSVEACSTFGARRRRGLMTAPADDAVADELERLAARLETAGYEHYEVSSWARPGARAVHNALYWAGEEYLGLGSGAHSFLARRGGGQRWSGHRSVHRYLGERPGAGVFPDALVAASEELDEAAVARDRVWLGLRTSDGIVSALLDGREAELRRLVDLGLVERHAGRVRPTRRGLLFADELGARLM